MGRFFHEVLGGGRGTTWRWAAGVPQAGPPSRRLPGPSRKALVAGQGGHAAVGSPCEHVWSAAAH